MNRFLQVFSEANGQLSSTRINTTIAAFSAIALSVFVVIQATLFERPISSEVIWVIGTLFTYSGVTKGLNKAFEEKPGEKGESNDTPS